MPHYHAWWFAALVAALCAAAASGAGVRCFLLEALPYYADEVHTQFSYAIDTLDAEPLELSFPTLEFGPVLDDRCTWTPKQDALVLSSNGILTASYPTHCNDGSLMGFGVSTLGAEVWGETPRSPRFSGRPYAPQNGRVDMRTMSIRGQPARLRNITVSLFSSSRREFMPGAPRPPALVVRVCMLAERVPGDWMSTSYTEVPPPADTVYPLATCVYERNDLCGASLGYVSTGDVVLKAHTHANHLAPSGVENGWTLGSVFAAGARLPADLDPHWHVGWRCEQGDVHWHINGTRLALDGLTPRCPPDLYAVASEQSQYGATIKGVSPMHKLAMPTREHKMTIEKAQTYWAANHVDQPVLADRVEQGAKK